MSDLAQAPLQERVAAWRKQKQKQKRGRSRRPQKPQKSKKPFRILRRRLGEMGYRSYEQYLATEHWRKTRERQPRTACQGCGLTTNLHLHHLTYERLGGELPTDLAWLCETCHRQIHRSGIRSFPRNAPIRSLEK